MVLLRPSLAITNTSGVLFSKTEIKKMKLEELYKDIIGVVCDVTGLVEADILASNREECADARYLLVMALSKMLTDHEIGRFINRTQQGVSFIRSNRQKLRKWTVASNWKVISKYIASNYFICK